MRTNPWVRFSNRALVVALAVQAVIAGSLYYFLLRQTDAEDPLREALFFSGFVSVATLVFTLTRRRKQARDPSSGAER